MEQVEGIRIASRAKDSSFDGKRTTKTTIGLQLTIERLLIKNERKDQKNNSVSCPRLCSHTALKAIALACDKRDQQAVHIVTFSNHCKRSEPRENVRATPEKDDLARRLRIEWKTVFALTQINFIDSRPRLGYVLLFGPRERGGHVQEKS